jgi:hypothetical protein
MRLSVKPGPEDCIPTLDQRDSKFEILIPKPETNSKHEIRNPKKEASGINCFNFVAEPDHAEGSPSLPAAASETG